uniref:Uncharacterized protein n=1 Tax=Vitis vinifera TaxID=29760 RepID=F6HR55_VITVI
MDQAGVGLSKGMGKGEPFLQEGSRVDPQLTSFNGLGFGLGEQANQALLNFKGLRDSFSTEAFFIRGMENIREKYGTTMEEEMMVLLVENSLLSSDVALFAEVTRLPSSIPLPASFWG